MATVHGVAKSQTQLRTLAHICVHVYWYTHIHECVSMFTYTKKISGIIQRNWVIGWRRKGHVSKVFIEKKKFEITCLPKGRKKALWLKKRYWQKGSYLVTQAVKNLPAMRETWVRSLGWEDALEEGTTTHSSTLAWRIPTDRGAWRATVHGVTESRTRVND